MITDRNWNVWLDSLSSETAALWRALHDILDPLRWSGGRPDPSGEAVLPQHLAVYEVFVLPRLADFKVVSRGTVAGQTVDSAHDRFRTISTTLLNGIQTWPPELDTPAGMTKAGHLMSGLLGVLPELAHEASRMPAEPLRRIRCVLADRSVWLDGKRIAEGVEPAVFAFFSFLNASYPDSISFAEMKRLSGDLDGENQSRLLQKMPPKLYRHVKSIRGKGYTLKMPKSPS